MAITSNGTGGGVWSAGASWAGGVAPGNTDTVIIAAGDTIIVDQDYSAAWAAGLAGITITSHATTPGMLTFKSDADGTYSIKIATGGTIAGTNAAAKGRLLVNSDGVWGNTGALPFGRKAIIDLITTAKIDALYLDIALYGYEPSVKSATVYNTIQTVSSIATATDVITCGGAHGWAAGTPVMVTSSGAYPGGLAADTVYYVRSPSGADLKLATQNADINIVDITSSGSGTIRIFDGHSNTSTATVNVLEDLRAVTGWTTTDGHDYVVLADAAAPESYDQQRLQLTTIDAGTLVLSANVDSAQYPGARVWLMSRNVSIRSSCAAAVNIVDYGAGTHGGVFQCEIRSTAGTGTTFYGTGVGGGTGHTISGAVSGCSYGVGGGTGHTISGAVSGCSYGVYTGSGHTISGAVSGCGSGVSGGSGHTISGAVSGCGTGVNGGSGRLVGAALSGNTQDIRLEGGTWLGYAATLGSTVQVSFYKHSITPCAEVKFGVMLADTGTAEYIGGWTAGGYVKTAVYAAGTHGTPPIASAYIHEMTFEDNDRVCWFEYAILGVSGQAVTATLYGKLTGFAAFATRPTIGIYDPTKGWQTVAEALNVSAQMAASTDWQTLTATYTPAHDRELRVRVQGVGGNAGGTGTEKLYWFLETSLGGSGGGGGPVIGSRIIRGLGVV